MSPNTIDLVIDLLSDEDSRRVFAQEMLNESEEA